jgi:hypothetical protein
MSEVRVSDYPHCVTDRAPQTGGDCADFPRFYSKGKKIAAIDKKIAAISLLFCNHHDGQVSAVSGSCSFCRTGGWQYSTPDDKSHLNSCGRGERRLHRHLLRYFESRPGVRWRIEGRGAAMEAPYAAGEAIQSGKAKLCRKRGFQTCR